MRPALLAVLLLPACATLAPERTATLDPGGSVVLRAIEIDRLEARGEERRIAGECLSACTMFLGLSTACFEEGAVLGFHAPRLPGDAALSPLAFDVATRRMGDYYPPRVRDWWLREARHSDRLIRVPAAELIRRGEARACPP